MTYMRPGSISGIKKGLSLLESASSTHSLLFFSAWVWRVLVKKMRSLLLWVTSSI